MWLVDVPTVVLNPFEEVQTKIDRAGGLKICGSRQNSRFFAGLVIFNWQP